MEEIKAITENAMSGETYFSLSILIQVTAKILFFIVALVYVNIDSPIVRDF